MGMLINSEDIRLG